MSSVVEPTVVETNEKSQGNITPGENRVDSSTTEASQDSEKEINWKRFREAREVDRKRREEAERESQKKAEENMALRAALESVVSRPQQNTSYDQPEETEEQKITRLVDARMADRDKKDQEARAIREQQELPNRLSSNFSDFNQVCSSENLDYLEYHYPEISAAFKNLPDSYDKWSNIYKAVKRFVANPNSGKDQKKAEKNFGKPQSMAAPGVTSTTDNAPIMLDEKRRQDNWRRMQQRIKGG